MRHGRPHRLAVATHVYSAGLVYSVLSGIEGPLVIRAKLRKSGNSYIVTVPREEVQRLELQAGQLVAVEVHPLDVRPALTPDLRAVFEASWKRNEAGYRYLAGR